MYLYNVEYTIYRLINEDHSHSFVYEYVVRTFYTSAFL